MIAMDIYRAVCDTYCLPTIMRYMYMNLDNASYNLCLSLCDFTTGRINQYILMSRLGHADNCVENKQISFDEAIDLSVKYNSSDIVKTLIKIKETVRDYTVMACFVNMKLANLQRNHNKILASIDSVHSDVVYLGDLGVRDGRHLIKYGRTADIKKRFLQHRRDFGTFYVIKVIPTAHIQRLENMVGDELQRQGHRTKMNLPGQTRTSMEIINITDEFTISDCMELFDRVYVDMMNLLNRPPVVQNISPIRVTDDSLVTVGNVKVTVHQKDLIDEFMRRLVITGDLTDYITSNSIEEEFHTWKMGVKQDVGIGIRSFKNYLTSLVGTPLSTHRIPGTDQRIQGWRGCKLNEPVQVAQFL